MSYFLPPAFSDPNIRALLLLLFHPLRLLLLLLHLFLPPLRLDPIRFGSLVHLFLTPVHVNGEYDCHHHRHCSIATLLGLLSIPSLICDIIILQPYVRSLRSLRSLPFSRARLRPMNDLFDPTQTGQSRRVHSSPSDSQLSQ